MTGEEKLYHNLYKSSPILHPVAMNRPPVLTQMTTQIHTWKEAGDKRYLFLSCYALMTGNMLQAIDTGVFRDAAWVRNLLERFADYYFEGLERCISGDPGRPRIWEYTHRVTRNCRVHVMQSVLLGINAHINYDLVLTLKEILGKEWDTLDDATKALRHEDHLQVNEIIAKTIDVVQDEVIEPQDHFMDVIDHVMGRMDEYLLSQLIRSWRSEVWEITMQMLGEKDPATLEEMRARLEHHSLGTARHILMRTAGIR